MYIIYIYIGKKKYINLITGITKKNNSKKEIGNKSEKLEQIIIFLQFHLFYYYNLIFFFIIF